MPNYLKENPKQLVLIFTRNPELGKCKTRLAATIGDQAALEIYKWLLSHTVSKTKNLAVRKEVYYSELIWENDIWDNTIYHKKLQEGKDLGERMANAFTAGFERGFQHIIIIGSDLYDLEEEDIQEAFKSLKTVDYVIGPAQDGGYYLLGMRKPSTNIFRNKKWGTSTVLEDTLLDLKSEQVQLLDIKNDIDVYEDIEGLIDFVPFLKNNKE